MQFTIIRDDRAVYKNGVCYFDFDMSVVPPNVHALQWSNGVGRIEYTDSPPVEIRSLPDWARICETAWDAVDFATKNPPPPTMEELLATCKSEARIRLQATDYTELSDVQDALLNKDEFTTYRAAIRSIYFNPVVAPEWPEVPTAQWKDISLG